MKFFFITTLVVLIMAIGVFSLSGILYERTEIKAYRGLTNKCILYEIEKILILYYLKEERYPAGKDLLEIIKRRGYPNKFGCGETNILESENITDIDGNEFVYQVVDANYVIFYFDTDNPEKNHLKSNQLIKNY